MSELWLLPVSWESLRNCAANEGWSVIVNRGFRVVIVHRSNISDALQALVHHGANDDLDCSEFGETRESPGYCRPLNSGTVSASLPWGYTPYPNSFFFGFLPDHFSNGEAEVFP